MLTLQIITKDKTEDLHVIDEYIHWMAYAGSQQKIFLQNKKPKETVKPGYFSAHFNIPLEKGIGQNIVKSFIEKLQNISYGVMPGMVKITFPYETNQGKTTDIILAFNLNEIKPFEIDTDMVSYYKVDGNVTELPF